MSKIVEALVVNQDEISPGHFRLRLAAPEVAGLAVPGQFLQLSVGNTLDPLLRRPLSIHDVDEAKGEVLLFYRVAGRGTGLLARKGAGATVNLLGPLGREFTPPTADSQPVLVAGGMGIAPLFFLLRKLAQRGRLAQVFLGAVTAELLFFREEIQAMEHQLHLATDDGSLGYKGTVTSLLADYLADLPPTERCQQMVYSCGPPGMLKHICSILNKTGLPGEISLEEHMGCGVGACLSCVCKIKEEQDDWRYQRICTEGPVFPAAKVVWA